MRLLALSALFAFVVDQLSKVIVVHWMNLKQVVAFDVFPPYLNFRMGWNRGVNFGLFSQDSDGSRWILIGLAIMICAVVLFWTRQEDDPKVKLSAGLLIGGALANVLDRILYGAVADFLNMSCCGFHNPFTFNIADAFIFAGAFGLILWTGKTKTP